MSKNSGARPPCGCGEREHLERELAKSRALVEQIDGSNERLHADRDALAAHVERLREALVTVEHEASLIHDFIWPRIIGDGQHAPDQKEASDAIWRIHNAARPALAATPAQSLAERPVTRRAHLDRR